MRRFMACIAVVMVFAGLAGADTFTERWYLAAGGIQSGANTYANRAPGPDRLPYTDDDVTVPAEGNAGGTWSFGFLDVESDGKDEHAFCTVRRGDDDMFTLSTWSDFAHGVLADGELWIDAHNVRNEGPAGADPTGDDLEWNDSPGWESESNWFWYNNMRANQRGLGGSRYYFEYRDPIAWPDEALQEVQNWVWQLTLKNNVDDGTGVKGTWGQAADLLVKGLFIPVEAIPALANGELDPLFGWQDMDMASYVRDTLYPKLIDPALEIFINSEGSNACQAASALPPAFVMILQAEARVLVTDPFKAAIWDLSLDEEATFRWSGFYIKGDGDDNPPIDLEPADGRPLNLWRRDSFVRKTAGDLGALELGTTVCPDHCWAFVDDGVEDCQTDYALKLPAASGPEESYFTLPVGRELDGRTGAVVARARVAFENPEIEGNGIDLILADGAAPVAWASVKGGGKPRLGIGGDSLAGSLGIIQNPLEESEGPVVVDLARETEGYSEVELLFAPKDARLELRIDGTVVHTFTSTKAAGSSASSLWFHAESDGAETGVTVDDVAVLQEYYTEPSAEPLFKRGDANADGSLNIADAVAALSYLFTQGSLSCLDAGDSNDDGQVNIADAVYSLSFLFGGGPAPPAPGHTACGPDPTADPSSPGQDLGCLQHAACQ